MRRLFNTSCIHCSHIFRRSVAHALVGTTVIHIAGLCIDHCCGVPAFRRLRMIVAGKSEGSHAQYKKRLHQYLLFFEVSIFILESILCVVSLILLPMPVSVMLVFILVEVESVFDLSEDELLQAANSPAARITMRYFFIKMFLTG